MDPASSQALSSNPTSLAINTIKTATTTNQSPLCMQLMTATGVPVSGGGSTGATTNKTPQPVASRKVLSADLSNYNLDHLYCHTNDKKTNTTNQPPASPYMQRAAIGAPAGGLPPNTDMGSVLKEIKQLKAMLLLHLDLIQEQSDQLASKDKLVLGLRKENEALRQRVSELTAPAPQQPVSASTPTTTTTTPSSPAVVITKSGRFSKPVLAVAVAKDDAANKDRVTSHSVGAVQAKQTPSTAPALQPKNEPLDAPLDAAQPMGDTKSEMLKKISSKLLANCSEKLSILSATIENAMSSTPTTTSPHQTRTSPTDHTKTRPTQDENQCAAAGVVVRPSCESPIDTKPDLGGLLRSNIVHPHIIGERDGKLISKIMLQRVQEQGATSAVDLLTTFKVEDLGVDLREIIKDYVSVRTQQEDETDKTLTPSTVEVSEQLSATTNVPVKLSRPAHISRRRRRRHDTLGIPKKRRKVARPAEHGNPDPANMLPDDNNAAPSRIAGTAGPPGVASATVPLAPPPPPPPPAAPRDRAAYTGRRSFMTTKQLYATREWQMDEIADAVNHQIADFGDEERPSAALESSRKAEDVNLEIPRWKERELSPLTSSEGTEDLSVEAFHKRHARLELDEKKRKKWDIQRIREQRNVERLRRRLLKDEPTDVADGAEDVGSFYPPAENIKFVQITDDLPIQAFGEFIPVISAAEFGLPWQTAPSRPAFAASPAGHLRSSDRAVASTASAAAAIGGPSHTAIQLVKKKCVRRHLSVAAAPTFVSTLHPSGSTGGASKGRSTKRAKR